MSPYSESISTPEQLRGWSADVRFHLLVDGAVVALAQIGGGRLYFDQPITLRPGPAEVVMTVNGDTRRWAIAIAETTEPARAISFEFRA